MLFLFTPQLADLESSRDGVSKQQEVYYEQSMKDMQEHTRVSIFRKLQL